LVSVVIPAYRAAQYIAAALDSVLAQTFKDFETIVVNDGSPDTVELEQVLGPYRDRILYLCQANQGLSGARNTGIRAARGKYIAPLDADDLWAPECLEAQLALLEADPSIDVLYGDARIIGDGLAAGRTVMELCPSAGEVTFERLVTRQCTVHVCVAVCRRETLVRAGLFDPELQRVQDIDLWVRLVRQGGRIAYHRRVLGYYRRHAGTLSADAVPMLEEYIAVLTKAARDPHLTPAQRDVLENQGVVERVSLELEKGKRAFLAGDAETAVRHLAGANAQHKSLRLSAVLMMLRVAPGFLRALHRWRDRYFYKLKTRS